MQKHTLDEIEAIFREMGINSKKIDFNLIKTSLLPELPSDNEPITIMYTTTNTKIVVQKEDKDAQLA